VAVRARLALLEAGREEEVQLLVGEPWRGEERCDLHPVAAIQPRLLGELALRRGERLLPLLDQPSRELEDVATGRDALLADERDVIVAVDGDDRDRGIVDDDIALVAPLDTEDRPFV